MRQFNNIVGKRIQFCHYMSTFLAGLVIGFVSAHRLALLTMAVIPKLLSSAVYTLIGITSKSHESYDNANVIAKQVIAQMIMFFFLLIQSKDEIVISQINI